MHMYIYVHNTLHLEDLACKDNHNTWTKDLNPTPFVLTNTYGRILISYCFNLYDSHWIMIYSGVKSKQAHNR